MITFFTIPKPFEGHIGVIQYNAIRSWTLAGDGIRVVLMGNEPGTAQAAAELGVEHHPTIETNRYGTPLLNSLFAAVEHHSDDLYLNYINADIIVFDDFLASFKAILRRKRRFLMVGQRTDLDVHESIDFSNSGVVELQDKARQSGKLRGPVAIDYFVYRRGMWTGDGNMTHRESGSRIRGLPSFAVGRFSWDNWLIYRARSLFVPVVDASDQVLVVHQNHDYAHAGGVKKARFGPEAQSNLALAGGRANLYTIWDSTHVLTDQGLKSRESRSGANSEDTVRANSGVEGSGAIVGRSGLA